MSFEVCRSQPLRHNPTNAVTAAVDRVTDPLGRTLVRKRIQPPPRATEPADLQWAASDEPTHWNYWLREAEAYRCADLRTSLNVAGLDMPLAEVEEHADGVTLWLEDVAGTPGADFTLEDHAALAEGIGRWQAEGPFDVPWASHGFLRNYSGSRRVPWHLADDEVSWQQPLIRDTWPDGLRAGWRRLLDRREALLTVMEHLPRVRSHLDLWVSNEIRRPAGQVALLDWSFFGDGGVGEDIGNHVPDAVFDLFWPAERLDELDDACLEAYTVGLRQAGWRGDKRLIRLGMTASSVKYAWLLPLMLSRASESAHAAYHDAADSQALYHQRGLALRHLVRWADEAIRLCA